MFTVRTLDPVAWRTSLRKLFTLVMVACVLLCQAALTRVTLASVDAGDEDAEFDESEPSKLVPRTNDLATLITVETERAAARLKTTARK